jgi:hypothetical protein
MVNLPTVFVDSGFTGAGMNKTPWAISDKAPAPIRMDFCNSICDIFFKRIAQNKRFFVLIAFT